MRLRATSCHRHWRSGSTLLVPTLTLLAVIYAMAATAAAASINSAVNFANLSVPMRHSKARLRQQQHHQQQQQQHLMTMDELWEPKSLYHHTELKLLPAEGAKMLGPELRSRLYHETDHDHSSVSCCPTVAEMVEPVAGKNQQGAAVELYRDDRYDYRQRFYELSCHEDVKNKPCRFADKRFQNRTRCVQQYSWTYALVKESKGSKGKLHIPAIPMNSTATYTLDYISVRSGCSCVALPGESWSGEKHGKKRKTKKKRPKSGVT